MESNKGFFRVSSGPAFVFEKTDTNNQTIPKVGLGTTPAEKRRFIFSGVC